MPDENGELPLKVARLVAKYDQDEHVLPVNKADFRQFVKALLARPVSLRRACKYWNHIRGLATLSEKPLRDSTKEDVIDLANKVTHNPAWRPSTRRDYLITAKLFFRWRDGDNTRSSLFKAGKPPRLYIPEGEVVTPAEIMKLAARCKDVRERAVLVLLYESAASESEFCGMRVKDAWMQPPFLMFHLPGTKNKYRDRTVPIQSEEAQRLFADYLRHHPQATNPEAPLWTNTRGRPLESRIIWNLLRRLKTESGLRKRLNPHWLRHSRLSELGKAVPELQLKVYAGHSPASTETQIYVHAGLNTLCDALLKQYPEGRESRRTRVTRKVLAEAVKDVRFLDLMVDVAAQAGALGELADAWGPEVSSLTKINYPAGEI